MLKVERFVNVGSIISMVSDFISRCFDGQEAAPAEGGMFGVRSDIFFPMPATLAFPAFCLGHLNGPIFRATVLAHDQL